MNNLWHHGQFSLSCIPEISMKQLQQMNLTSWKIQMTNKFKKAWKFQHTHADTDKSARSRVIRRTSTGNCMSAHFWIHRPSHPPPPARPTYSLVTMVISHLETDCIIIRVEILQWHRVPHPTTLYCYTDSYFSLDNMQFLITSIKHSFLLSNNDVKKKFLYY